MILQSVHTDVRCLIIYIEPASYSPSGDCRKLNVAPYATLPLAGGSASKRRGGA